MHKNRIEHDKSVVVAVAYPQTILWEQNILVNSFQLQFTAKSWNLNFT